MFTIFLTQRFITRHFLRLLTSYPLVTLMNSIYWFVASSKIFFRTFLRQGWLPFKCCSDQMPAKCHFKQISISSIAISPNAVLPNDTLTIPTVNNFENYSISLNWLQWKLGSILFRPRPCFLWPAATNYMLLYSTLLCKKTARGPGGHKNSMLTKMGRRNRIDPNALSKFKAKCVRIITLHKNGSAIDQRSKQMKSSML